jgi:signal recognition particle subunit SRP54
MTKAERKRPHLVENDRKRRLRIAKGSGRDLAEVEDMLERFSLGRAVGSHIAQGRMGGADGMGGFPSMRRFNAMIRGMAPMPTMFSRQTNSKEKKDKRKREKLARKKNKKRK